MIEFKPGDWVKLVYRGESYYGKVSEILTDERLSFRVRRRPDNNYTADSHDVQWKASNLVHATQDEIKLIPWVKGDILRHVSSGADYAVEYDQFVNTSFAGKVVYTKLNSALPHTRVGYRGESFTIDAFEHLISPHIYMSGAPLTVETEQAEEEPVYRFKKGELALRNHTDETVILMITDRTGHFANAVIISSTDPNMPIGTAIISIPITNMEPLLNAKINITLNN